MASSLERPVMLVISTRRSSRGCEVMSSVMDRARCLKIWERDSDVEGLTASHGHGFSYIPI